MTRRDIINCTDIEKLKQICLAQRNQLNYVGEVLVDESKWEISAKDAITEIRNYLVEHQYDIEM